MINDVNDSKEHAEKLAKLLKNTTGHLNLIFLSNVEDRDYQTGTQKNAKVFTGILKANGINHTIRRSLGSDIEASCGQLRRRTLLTAGKESRV